VRVVVLSALCLVAGCDGLFGLTHLRSPGDDDDASVSDTTGDSHTADAMTDGGRTPDAYVQKNCIELGYTSQIGGSATHYRNSGGVKRSWTAAEVDCQDDAAPANNVHTHLVVLSDDVEASNVYSGVMFSPVGESFWIGLSDQITANNFKWVTDEVTGYPAASMGAPWEVGEASGGAGEDCVVDSPMIKMSDVPCAVQHLYACECDANPVNENNF